MIERETKETKIRCDARPGKGHADIRFEGIHAGSEPGRGLGGTEVFAKHMLETLAKWSGYDITLHVVAKDHLEHHAIEDAAIALGKALRQSIDTGAIERTAHVLMPMDDALVSVALDLVERPYYEGPLPDPLMDHVMRSLATEGGFTLHVLTLRGRDPHHIVEAAFKGLALCQGARPVLGARDAATGGAAEHQGVGRPARSRMTTLHAKPQSRQDDATPSTAFARLCAFGASRETSPSGAWEAC
jgi:imidazoleglycerol-phosphate dehydratase